MRVLVQRVSRAAVRVRGGGGGGGSRTTGAIGPGLLLLVGLTHGDGDAELAWMADKVLGLRVFADDEGRMNRALGEVPGAAVLAVSQFTLYGDAARGRRPSYGAAARPEAAAPLYDAFVARLRGAGARVETGEFGAAMDVELVNDGPVTLWLAREPAGAGAAAAAAAEVAP